MKRAFDAGQEHDSDVFTFSPVERREVINVESVWSAVVVSIIWSSLHSIRALRM